MDVFLFFIMCHFPLPPLIQSMVLARHFCGVKFSLMIDDESREGPVNVVLFDNLSGHRIFQLRDVMAYGTT